MAAIEYRRDPGGWMVRWDAELAARAVAEGDWPNRTVADYARDRALVDPDRVLLTERDGTYSAGFLYGHAQKLAGWFTSIGMRPGDVVSFQLPNWWEAAVINIAAAMTGVVVNPIVPINREAEVTYMLSAARTRVMFVPETFRGFDYAAMMRRLLPAMEIPPQVVVVRGSVSSFLQFGALIADASSIVDLGSVDPNAVKLLMYTSGTTGRPKGVLHSHNSINADSSKMALAMQATAQDSTFSPSPLTHVSGYLWALNMPWYGDVPVVIMDIWEPETAVNLLQDNRCTFALGATPFLRDLVRVVKQRGTTLDALRYFQCGGASVPPNLIYEAAALFPCCIPWRNFGCTEAPTMTRPPATRADQWLGAETDGRLYRCEVKIVDVHSGVPVPQGEEGEILVREPAMALGYAQREDNDSAYDEDGYFRMGDLVRIVEGDHVLCTGRKKDLIIRSGENISAKEIEDVLFLSPDVLDVAVVSMPSAKTGEIACAFIVPAKGVVVDLETVGILIAEAGLARQKTPEHVVLVDDLPKTASGKVRKDILREHSKLISSQLHALS